MMAQEYWSFSLHPGSVHQNCNTHIDQGQKNAFVIVIQPISGESLQWRIRINGFMTIFQYPYTPCMVYLPTKLDDFVRVNVGKYSIHGAFGIKITC
jgi:hypothetical protein